MTETVSLRDICKELKLDPREARVKLRATGKRAPKGKWEWPRSQVAAIKAVLRGDTPKKPATKTAKKKAAKKKPAGHSPAARKPEATVAAASPAATEAKPT